METDSFLTDIPAFFSCEKVCTEIKNRFGIPVSIHPLASIIATELIESKRFKEAVEILKAESKPNPTDIDLFAQLVAELKKNKLADYKEYEAKLLDMFKNNLTKNEQKDWMEWIDKNNR